jgi:Holliday junction DNA helicase RuvA
LFNSISGTLTFKNSEHAFILTNGIEWNIAITASTLVELPETGRECTLYVYLSHREDRMQLFGFASTEERRLFLELIRVESIGPATACRILSRISVRELLAAIESANPALLSSVPGIGKKTAEKIIFKLKGSIVSGGDASGFEEIAKALAGMGFDIASARNAVRQAAGELDSESPSKDHEREVFTAALKKLGRS